MPARVLSDAMSLEPVPVERLDVLVLVDNVTDSLSTNPPDVRPELARLVALGMPAWSGAAMAVAHHGLALLVTAHAGGSDRTVLFDTGPEGGVFARNAARLGADLAAVEALVLSHGHWDHVGGVVEALGLVAKARGGAGGVPVHVNDGMFARRGMRLPSGAVLPFEDVPAPERIAAAGGDVVSSAAPRLLADGRFFLSGEIARATAYEQGFPNHVRAAPDGAWEPDPLLLDERYLAAHVAGKGFVVLTACSHAGVVNVLRDARDRFPGVPLHAVLGGLHLAGAGPEKAIAETVRDLAALGLARVAPAHCTGWRAVRALVDALGEGVVVPAAVGKAYAF